MSTPRNTRTQPSDVSTATLEGESHRLRILCIEHDPLLGRTLSGRLEQRGHEATLVPTGEHGLGACAERCFDVVSLGQASSGASGLEVLGALSEMDSGLPVVVVVEPGREHVAAAAMRAGAADYIIKDADGVFLELLPGTLERACRHRRLEAEQESREATIRLLEAINEETDLPDLMRSVLGIMRSVSDCEAVGIRLRDGDDYPYYEVSGFSPEFVKAETRLCARTLDGQLARDELGNPVLDCMCGNIICGRFDPSMDFFTDSGSFISNGTSELLASTSEEDRNARTRNRCNAEGYESVLLVPLRRGAEVFGLLQFNDHRKRQFPPELVELAERLGGYVAIALAQRHAEERLGETRYRSEQYISSLPGLFYVFDDERFVKWNSQWNRVTGYSNRELSDMYATDFFEGDDRTLIASRMKQLFSGGVAEVHAEASIVTKDGRQIPFSFNGVRMTTGGADYLLGFGMDITERRRAEESLECRTRYLAGLSSAAEVLLTVPDTVPFQEFVDRLGPTCDACRAYVFTVHRAPDGVALASQVAEWCADGVESQSDAPGPLGTPHVEPFHRWAEGHGSEELLLGRASASSDEERELLESRGVPAILLLRLMVEGEFVGFMGFDSSTTASEWDDTAVTFLATAANDLARAIRRARSEERVRSSLAEKDVLLREVHHRVKNNMQVVSSLLSLQARRVGSGAALQALEHSQARVQAMALVHETLYGSSSMSHIPMDEYFARLVDDVGRLHVNEMDRVSCLVEAEGVTLPIDDAVPIGLVSNELLTNALQHAFVDGREGQARIALRDLGDGQMELLISDDGVGIPRQGADGGVQTLGLQLVTSLVERQLRGSLEMDCGKGTAFRIRFRRSGRVR